MHHDYKELRASLWADLLRVVTADATDTKHIVLTSIDHNLSLLHHDDWLFNPYGNVVALLREIDPKTIEMAYIKGLVGTIQALDNEAKRKAKAEANAKP